jgi:hypothetical protein
MADHPANHVTKQHIYELFSRIQVVWVAGDMQTTCFCGVQTICF